MFFVSVDSKKLSHFVSLLFSTLTSKSTSVDSKGLALHQNCAEKSCFSFVFKRIRRGTLKRKSGSGQFPVSVFIRRMVELSYCLAHHLIDTLGVLLRNNQTGHLEACPRSPMR